jgi:DNA helicase II / ATP-dependent DNA helicase PcrA
LANDNAILAELTEAQREAVTRMDGAVLVLAGPGSGKTRVITCRVAYLIQQGVRSWHILGLTFTNKAAQEMRNRLLAMDLPAGATLCTFHSLAARLLREFADRAGLNRNFSIYDDADQKTAVREAIKACQMNTKDFTPGRILNIISKYKNDLITPDQLTGDNANFFEKRVAAVYTAYQKELERNAALDFDDLLLKLAFLLRDNEELRELLNRRYQYILVDEYQDTNHCQYLIAKALAMGHGNLCVTGDPDQSIYGWRGANIKNILSFEKDYPNAAVIRLEENFRSTPQVLDVADQVIQRNVQRKEKRLFTHNADGPAPQLIQYADEEREARGMVEWIKTMQQRGFEYRDMAVFYRINSLSRGLEEALIRGHIPYQIVRGVEFYHRKEIKDMLAYLRLIVNPSDQVALKRVINRPARGIGETTINRIFSLADQVGLEPSRILVRTDLLAAIPAAAQKRLKAFAEMIETFRVKSEAEKDTTVPFSVADFMKLVYEKSGLAAALAEEKEEEPVANVEELINSAVEYERRTENPSLMDYLHQISLVSDADKYDSQAGAVSLMTLHAAKGLEFGAVRIVGVENGLVPHTRSQEDGNVEEERRLLFVGITRAKKTLSLSLSRRRIVMGADTATMMSPFLYHIEGIMHEVDDSDEIPDSHEDAAEPHPDDDSEEEPHRAPFKRGQLVRHPTLGLGRIEQYIPSHNDSRVVVRFGSGQRKTLVLKYAKLTKIGREDY